MGKRKYTLIYRHKQAVGLIDTDYKAHHLNLLPVRETKFNACTRTQIILSDCRPICQFRHSTLCYAHYAQHVLPLSVRSRCWQIYTTFGFGVTI